jgi:aryl-alcohol dehydrogenase-like predicted oxidoreductase
MDLKSYITLGRTGLRVSPLCLGAMTFGTEWGWGADETVSRSMFDRYVDRRRLSKRAKRADVREIHQ